MAIKTGFRDIDDRIGGLGNGELICMASSPNKDLTTFVYNIVNNVTKNNIQPYYFQEMQKNIQNKNL